ncbi:MAG: hypothetical protein ACC618_02860 [Patescibacteria group bacterium]
MVSINLLPPELKPKEGILKISGIAKRISIIGFSVLLVSITIMVIGVIVLGRQLDEAKSNQERLKNTIRSLEETEVRLVLVKDRLSKISQINKIEDTEDEIDSLASLVQIFPEGVSLDKTELRARDSKVEIKVQNTQVLTKLLADLLASGIYKSVKMESLDYNQQTGFNIVFRFSS